MIVLLFDNSRVDVSKYLFSSHSTDGKFEAWKTTRPGGDCAIACTSWRVARGGFSPTFHSSSSSLASRRREQRAASSEYSEYNEHAAWRPASPTPRITAVHRHGTPTWVSLSSPSRPRPLRRPTLRGHTGIPTATA